MTLSNENLISSYFSKFEINKLTNIYEEDIFVDFYNKNTNENDFYNDVQFYKESIPKNNKIVELAAGTGRVTIPLIKNGFTVTGIERELAMIAKVPEEYRGNFIQEDIFNFKNLDKIYKELDTILIPATSISLFPINQIKILITKLVEINQHFDIIFDLLNYNKILFKYPKKEITSNGSFYYYNFLYEDYLIYNLFHKESNTLGYSIKYHHSIQTILQLFKESGLNVQIKEISDSYFIVTGSYRK